MESPRPQFMQKTFSKQDHVHKYYLSYLNDKKTFPVYICMLGCSHYRRLDIMVGKKSICWRCGEVFTFTIEQVKRKPRKPCCKSCVRRKGKRVTAKEAILDTAIDRMVEDAFKHLGLPSVHQVNESDKDDDLL